MDRNQVNCASIEELLPWYLNGTLGAEDNAAVVRHLETCPTCRQEHRDTAMAAASYAAHPTSEELVDFAFHRLGSRERQALLEAHLEFCPSCSEEIALVYQSRDALADLEHGEEFNPISDSEQEVGSVVPFARPTSLPTAEKESVSSGTVLRWAAAAGIAFLVTAMVWQMNRPSVGNSSTASIQPSDGTSSSGLREGANTSLERIRERLAGAPSWTAHKGDSGDRLIPNSKGIALLQFPSEDTEVVLWISDLGSTQGNRFSAQILGPEGELLWADRNLVADDQNKIQLHIPAEAFRAGNVSLELSRSDAESTDVTSSESLGSLQIDLRR